MCRILMFGHFNLMWGRDEVEFLRKVKLMLNIGNVRKRK